MLSNVLPYLPQHIKKKRGNCTAKNAEILPNVLVQKICRDATFRRVSGEFTRNSCETI